MRKVKYVVDDIQWFQRFYKFTDEQMDDLFKNQESFKVIYTLFGDEKQVDRYKLTDYAGNKIDYHSLNGYQRGVVLNDCYARFTGGKYHNEKDEPTGVILIEETTIESEEN